MSCVHAQNPLLFFPLLVLSVLKVKVVLSLCLRFLFFLPFCLENVSIIEANLLTWRQDFTAKLQFRKHAHRV